jgi:hypothetical protein
MRYFSDQLIQINPAPGRISFLNGIAHIPDNVVRPMRVRLDVTRDIWIYCIPAFALLMMAESG